MVSDGRIRKLAQARPSSFVDDRQSAHFRLVRTGKIYGDQVEVLSGLNDGQRYLKTVPPGMKDGAKVETE